MLCRNWLKRHFSSLNGISFNDVFSLNDWSRPKSPITGRRLRLETLEPRQLLAADLGGDPSAVLPNESTGFSYPTGSGNFSAQIDLTQVNSVTSIAIGAGEPSAQSTLRYVKATGSGNGTQANPWSLSQANSQLQAGETALMLSGTYNGMIKPNRAGTAGNPITYKPAPGANVHLRAIGSEYAINLAKDYILVEGLKVSRRDGRSGNSAYVTNIQIFSDHTTIRNMHVVNYGDHIAQARLYTETGISIRGKFGLVENNHVENMRSGIGLNTDRKGSFYNVVRGNTIADPVYDGISIGNGNGAPLHHLVENNVIFGAMVSDGITFDGRNDSNPVDHIGINQVIIRNNAIFNSGENNLDLKATKNILIEGNYLWKAFGDNDGSNVLNIHGGSTSLHNDEHGGFGITKGGTSASEHVIIRNNVMIDSNGAVPALTRYKIYNNTMVNNRRNAANGPNQPNTPLNGRKPLDAAISPSSPSSNAAILNNIMGDHAFEVTLRPSGTAAIDGNAYYNTFQTPQFSVFGTNYDWTVESFASWKSWLQTKSNYTGKEVHSQVVSSGPSGLFVNVPNQPVGDPAQFDFRLKANSPAIDSGVFLTKTIGSGSGTTMTVADAEMFFDGFGITLGDEIQLAGQTQRARITSITGNTLTLNHALTWSSGVGVSLSYEGASPDAGAIEFAGVIGPAAPTAVDDSATTSRNTPVTTPNVLANDYDPNPSDTLSVQSYTQPSHGSVTPNGSGTFLYTPNAGFHGSDAFTYLLSDGTGRTDTAAVNITVTPPGVSFTENFSNSSAMNNFTVVSGGNWAVSGGELQLTNPINGNPLGNVILHNTPTPADFSITIDAEVVTPVSSWGDFDILFNYQDANHYYFANFNQRENVATNTLKKYENGVETDLASFGSNLIVEGTKYEIKVVRTADLLQIYRDGVLLASLNDSSFVGGQMGLASKNDGVAFDNLLVNNVVVEDLGDFDTDGDVDGADFLSWQRGFGSTYVAADLTDWEDNFGTSTPPVAAATAAAPPAVTAPTSIEVDASASSASVVLALDLQTAAVNPSSQKEVFENAFARSKVLPADVALPLAFSLPAKQEAEGSTPFEIDFDPGEAEEINSISLDIMFELLGNSVA